MANFSTKIKIGCANNGVADVVFKKMLCCKMIVMERVHTLKNGTYLFKTKDLNCA
ncbi:MAG: hypothetical protein CM15mV128_150 [Caudoviricetes sp.]|nr:MAG: hypothetical protein CM15mV128_150 [Caudoviricetes sp.]